MLTCHHVEIFFSSISLLCKWFFKYVFCGLYKYAYGVTCGWSYMKKSEMLRDLSVKKLSPFFKYLLYKYLVHFFKNYLWCEIGTKVNVFNHIKNK